MGLLQRVNARHKVQHTCALWGTEGSNPVPSSGESAANLTPIRRQSGWRGRSDPGSEEIGIIRCGRSVKLAGREDLKMTFEPSSGDGAHRGLCPAHTAPGRYSRRLTTAAGARGHSIPRARGADFPPPRSPAAAKPTLLTGWGHLLLPGSKPLLHPADMASRPIKAAAFGAHPQWTAGGP
jgi:hypothetical protein